MFKNSHSVVKYYFDEFICEGDRVADATAGGGSDTLSLKLRVGQSGFVYSFDIQNEALIKTEKKLNENGITDGYKLIFDSHSNMDKHISEKLKAVVFNLGYLPGGDHSIHTKPDTTITAVEKSLDLISEDGFVIITIYHGGDSGFEERDRLLEYLQNLDNKKYNVLLYNFINKPNCPPMVAVITNEEFLRRKQLGKI
ncbi:MAG: class I SAM-dependent methyltransferase [Clostridia bacterium]|nr:class I SAM-dependent methyltransferase [Clostridia bacterium]